MLATKSAPVMIVDEVTDRESFLALADEWNQLVENTRDELFYRHEFIRVWIENFAPDAKIKILVGRDRSGRLVAALPLMEEVSSLFGLPVRQLVATANEHSARFDMI